MKIGPVTKPIGDHRHAISEFDQALRSGRILILDGDTAAPECVAMGKNKPHTSSNPRRSIYPQAPPHPAIRYLPLLGLEPQELERFSFLELTVGHASVNVRLVGTEVEFHHLAGFFGEVQFREIDPEDVWREH